MGSKTHWPLAVLQASRVHSFMSLQTFGVPTHWPPLQVSPVVQAIPSLQVPAAGLQAPSMGSQALQTAHVFAGPATQVPEVLHRSPWVQALPSSHRGRFGLAAPSHLPVVGLHSLQVVGLLQSTAVPAWQVPFWQWSPIVHMLLSALQDALLSLLANTQAPVASLQVPGDTWQVLVLVQTLGVPVQTPPMHLSCPGVQTLPSLQLVPLGLGGLHMPVMGSQLFWQFVGAGQVLAMPARHVPVWQLSPTVHRLPSSQGVPLSLDGLVQVPVIGLQVPAVWHWFGIGQVTGLVPLQVVPMQTSVRVQRLPSLQARPLRAAQVPSWAVPAPRLQA
jgi:hypothetical protein